MGGVPQHKVAERDRVGLVVKTGAPPKVVLLLPPCVAVVQKAVVQVHMEWEDRRPGGNGKFELMGTAQGIQIFSKSISRKDGKIARIEWFPAEVGVVDVFVLGTYPNGEVSVGELGHLLVLPPSVCKEANAIFEKMVANAGSDMCNSWDNMSIQLERAIVVLLQNWDAAAQQCLQNSSEMGTPLRSFPGLRRVDEYVRNITRTNGIDTSKPGADITNRDVTVNVDRPQIIHTPTSLGNHQRRVRVQKCVWRSAFRTLILDLDVLFQLLAARRRRMLQRQCGELQDRPADLDIAIKLIMGNVLRYLRKFEAWNFIAHVLHRCSDFEVEICWGEKELGKDSLTGIKLQEMAGRNDYDA